MKRWVMMDADGKLVAHHGDQPEGAICEMPKDLREEDLEICEVFVRQRNEGDRVVFEGRGIQISAELKRAREPVGKKRVVVKSANKEMVIEVQSNVVPQNYVRDAGPNEPLGEIKAKEKGWNEQTIIERIRAAFLR